jgi:hypothetical protein
MVASVSAAPSVSSSLDEILAHNYPKANVSITWSEFHSSMRINITVDQNNFLIYVAFSYMDMTTDFVRFDENVLSVIINEYQQHVTELVEDKEQLLTRRKMWNAESLLETIRNMTKIRKIAERLFRELRSVNVYTIQASNNNVMARTTVELDADIITIMPRQLSEAKINNNWLKLHRINVLLANYLFVYRMKKFVSLLKVMTNLARITSIALWLVSIATALLPAILSLNNLNIIYKIMYSVFIFLGGPTLLMKFMPKVLGYVIRHTILKNLQMK